MCWQAILTKFYEKKLVLYCTSLDNDNEQMDGISNNAKWVTPNDANERKWNVKNDRFVQFYWNCEILISDFA